MSRLLVAIDGSAHSDAALDTALALSRRDRDDVILVHVVTDTRPDEVTRQAISVEFADDFVERSRSLLGAGEAGDASAQARLILSHQDSVSRIINSIMGEQVLRRARERLTAGGVPGEVVMHMPDGDPAEHILSLAEAEQVDTIVIGCRGRGRLTSALLGSVSQRIAHDFDGRVIIVK